MGAVLQPTKVVMLQANTCKSWGLLQWFPWRQTEAANEDAVPGRRELQGCLSGVENQNLMQPYPCCCLEGFSRMEHSLKHAQFLSWRQFVGGRSQPGSSMIGRVDVAGTLVSWELCDHCQAVLWSVWSCTQVLCWLWLIQVLLVCRQLF